MNNPLNVAAAGSATLAGAQDVRYGTVRVRGLDIFYREAGAAQAPTVLLLHGFPSSSHMFRNLIPLLGAKYHVIAPDYPGFGQSSTPAPDSFTYTFANLAEVMADVTDALGLKSYVLYVQDYGGPVGLRLAMKSPDWLRGLIVQNAVANLEGWNMETVAPLTAYWRDRSSANEEAVRGFLAAPTTQFQYTHGAMRTDRLSPDAWIHDQAGLDRPGNDAIQLELLYQYQDNVAQYPAWQQFLKTRQPPTLVAWGDNDPFFTSAGRDLFKALIPQAEVHRFDAGHFALETHGPEIAGLALGFLGRLTSPH